MTIRELMDALAKRNPAYGPDCEVVVVLEDAPEHESRRSKGGVDPSFWTDCEIITTITEDGEFRIHVQKVEPGGGQ